MAVRPITLGLLCLILSGCATRQAKPVENPPPQPKKLAAPEAPPLISKLRYVRDESVSWLLLPGFLGQNRGLPFKYEDTQGQNNRAGAAMPVDVGQIFFEEGPAKGRFKYLGSITRAEINPAINVEVETTYAVVEDLKPSKAGMKYEFPAPIMQRDRAKYIQHDRSAVMVLEALGEGGKQMVIEENTRFALPPNAKKKDYLLKSVTPEQIVVEHTDADGQRVEVKIKKGCLPDFGH